jgi:hypothetical protein
MKIFRLKRDFIVGKNETKKDNNKRRNEIEKLFNIVWERATEYARENARFVFENGKKRKGYFKCSYSYHLWISDDRFWCKKGTDENGNAVFEQVFEITVMSIGELKLKLVKDLLGLYDKQMLIHTIKRIDENGEVELL